MSAYEDWEVAHGTKLVNYYGQVIVYKTASGWYTELDNYDGCYSYPISESLAQLMIAELGNEEKDVKRHNECTARWREEESKNNNE
jgi:hypothetical protein